MKTDEEIDDLLERWGRWLRKEPGISLEMRLQRLDAGGAPKRYNRPPSFVDPECDDVDRILASFCSKLVQKCLHLKYMGRKSQTTAADILTLPLGSYKAYVREGKFRLQTALDVLEYYQESA